MPPRRLKFEIQFKYILGLICLGAAVFLAILFKPHTGPVVYIIYLLTSIAIGGLFYKKDDKATVAFKDPTGNSVRVSGGVALVAFVILVVLNPIKKIFPDKIGLTVFVSEKNGNIPLRDKGYVRIIPLAEETQKKPIDENGEASFAKVQVGEQVKFDIDFSEPYRPINPDSLYIIDAIKKINLIVQLKGIEKIEGNVIYNNQPLEGVTVITDTLKTNTDINGSFLITVPENLQTKQYKVRFIKNGFNAKELMWFPQTGSQTVLMEK